MANKLQVTDRRESGKGGNFTTRANPFRQKEAAQPAPDLAEVALLGSTLDEVLRAGCAILIGRTRDGGAVVLTVLDGAQRHRTFCSTSDELEEAFLAMHNIYTSD